MFMIVFTLLHCRVTAPTSRNQIWWPDFDSRMVRHNAPLFCTKLLVTGISSQQFSRMESTGRISECVSTEREGGMELVNVGGLQRALDADTGTVLN